MKKKRRYSAMLIFQYERRSTHAQSMCLTESRMITFNAADGREAIAYANNYGLKNERWFKDDDGERLRFRFLGISDALELGLEADDCEVWYDVNMRKSYRGRFEKIFISQSELIKRLKSTK